MGDDFWTVVAVALFVSLIVNTIVWCGYGWWVSRDR